MSQTVFLTQHLPRELIVTIAKMLSPKLCSRMICKFCQKFWVGSVFMLGHNTYFKLARTPPTIYWLSPSLPLILSFFLSLSYSLSFLYLSLPAISRHFFQVVFPNLLSFSFFLSLSLPFFSPSPFVLCYLIFCSLTQSLFPFLLTSSPLFIPSFFVLCFFFIFLWGFKKFLSILLTPRFLLKRFRQECWNSQIFFLVCKFDSVSLQKFPSLAA